MVKGVTFIQALTAMLVENGLWNNEAEAVIARVREKDKTLMHWHDDISGYPDTVLPGLWMTTKREAIEYLEETAPRHFALMILKDEVPS